MSDSREDLRKERLDADEAVGQQERRQKLLKLLGAAVGAAVVIVVIAIVISQSGGEDSKSDTSAPKGLLSGIPQKGEILGDASAKVTVVEYGDLQCPICADYSHTVLPDVINGPVRSGDAKLQFKNWVIIGPQSIPAAKASIAAGNQNRYWQFIEDFYANQGTENGGYVTDQFLLKIAQDAGVPDLDRWQKDRRAVPTADLMAIDKQASGPLGFSGTPSFAIIDSEGKTTPLGTVDADAIKQAITEAQ